MPQSYEKQRQIRRSRYKYLAVPFSLPLFHRRCSRSFVEKIWIIFTYTRYVIYEITELAFTQSRCPIILSLVLRQSDSKYRKSHRCRAHIPQNFPRGLHAAET